MTAVESTAAAQHVLSHRDFRLLFTARGLGVLAAQMQTVAVGWQIYDLTGEPQALGYVGLAVFLPIAALTLPAGDIADRIDRRLILFCSYLTEAVCALLFFGLTVAGSTSVWPFYAIMALFGAGRAFFAPALQSFVPFLVPKPQFPTAVAWSSSANQLATIVGPAIGGLIYIAGPSAVYATCLVLFVAVAAASAAIRTRVAPAPAEPGSSALRRLLAGLAYIRRMPIVFGAISLDLFAMLLGGVTALLPVYARDILHIGPDGLGLLRSAQATGATCTALLVAHLPPPRRAGATMFGFVTLFGAATIVFGLSESFLLSLTALFIAGASDQVSVITRNTLIQLGTPETMRGRVTAVHVLFVGTSNGLGEFRAGTTAAWFGAMPAVVLGGAGTLAVVGLWAWLFPPLRKVGRLADVVAKESA